MVVCRKSSDATNVRWEPYDPDQGPGRDSSLGLISLRDVQGSYRVVPVALYLGVRDLGLKCVGERFEARGHRFGLVGKRRVGPGGRHRVRILVDQLVGEEQ
jgi:hypothetical protein